MQTRNAFTLIELLVVIAIATILMGFLVQQAGKALSNAREATCKTNLRNLAAACITFANEKASGGGRADLPYAGSYEIQNLWGDWYECRGWISWLPINNPRSDSSWPKWGKDVKEPNIDKMSDAAVEDTEYAIRKGTLFPYTSRDLRLYRCPNAVKVKNANPYLSYVMNEFFHYEGRKAWDPRCLTWMGTKERFNDEDESWLPEASRLLLFSEAGTNTWSGTTPKVGKNCVLAVPDTGSKIKFGAYHQGTSKGNWGLVIFLDEHIEKVSPETTDNKNRAYYLIRGLQTSK